MKKILAATLMLICLTSFGQIIKSERIYKRAGDDIIRNVITNYEDKQDTFYICSFRNEKYQHINDWISFSIDKKRLITFLDTCYKLLENYPINTIIIYEVNDDFMIIRKVNDFVSIVFDGGYFTLNYRQLKLMLGVMHKESRCFKAN